MHELTCRVVSSCGVIHRADLPRCIVLPQDLARGRLYSRRCIDVGLDGDNGGGSGVIWA